MSYNGKFNASTPDKVEHSRYAKLILDTAWKRCFASEENKELMRLLLQNLFPDREIASVEFEPTEHVNPFPGHKDVRTDVEVTDSSGKRFLVELQVDDEGSFNDRLLFYSSFAMQQQILKGRKERERRAARGELNLDDLYDFPPVYVISLLAYRHHSESDGVMRRYVVSDVKSGDVFSEKLNFVTIDMTIGVKRGLEADASFEERLSYALLKMQTLTEQPPELSGKFFDMLFNCAEITNFTAAEQLKYNEDMIEEQRKKAMLTERYLKGKEEGREEGSKARAIEIAKVMLAEGVPPDTIARYTNLPTEEVAKLHAK